VAFDGLVLTAVARELNETLGGGRIEKVQQFTDDDVVLVIRANRVNLRLLVSANRSWPRVHLTTQFAAQAPAQAPLFCMLLRKHIEGGRIAVIHQFKRERILFIDVDTYDELGGRVIRRLVVEIMGRHSNILLLDRPDGVIIDAATHLTHAANRHRVVMPGAPYCYPPHVDKIDPLYETEKRFLQRRVLEASVPIRNWLGEHYLGISPFFGREVQTLVDRLQAPGPQAEWRIVADLLQDARDVRQPMILEDAQGHMQAFYLFVPVHLSGKIRRMSSMNECIDTFYTARALSDMARAKTANYLRLIRTEREKAQHRIEKFTALLEAGQEAEQWRVAGELLTAYLQEVPRGADAVTLPNFYADETPLAIALDPARSPLDNANAYFRRYGKYKKGLAVTAEQLALAREDAAYLDSVIHELEQCRLEDVTAIESELREAGYLAAQKSLPAKTRKNQPSGGKRTAKGAKPKDKPSYLALFTSDGTPVWVGRNNRENDALTFKLAKKADTWLHVKDAPGSHVILPVADPTPEALYDAALLAAYYSSQRESTKVEVDVVPVRQLWRPNRARPGFALFEGQQTLVVTMDSTHVTNLITAPSIASSERAPSENAP